MSYRVILAPEAVARLAPFPPEILDRVEEELHRLAESPVALSRPAVFPDPPTAQVYEFEVDAGQELLDHFSVHFRYGQDEQSILIHAIGHIRYRRFPGPPNDEPEGVP